jgi:hypothetical protein
MIIVYYLLLVVIGYWMLLFGRVIYLIDWLIVINYFIIDEYYIFMVW